jgi:hypothetical protein
MATYYYNGRCYSSKNDQTGTPVSGHVTTRSNQDAVCKVVAQVHTEHGGIGYFDTVEVRNGSTGKATPVSPTQKSGLCNAPVAMHNGEAVWMGPLGK